MTQGGRRSNNQLRTKKKTTSKARKKTQVTRRGLKRNAKGRKALAGKSKKRMGKMINTNIENLMVQRVNRDFMDGGLAIVKETKIVGGFNNKLRKATARQIKQQNFAGALKSKPKGPIPAKK